jgi:hypothetical protein
MVDERTTRLEDTAAVEPAETSPWHHVPLRTIAAIAAPFWAYIALSNLAYGALLADKVLPSQVIARTMLFLVLTPMAIVCYKLALRVGWGSPPTARKVAAQAAIAFVFASSARFIQWAAYSLAMWDPSWMTSKRMELIPELKMIAAYFLDQLLSYFAGLAVVLGVLTYRRLRQVTLRAERAEREYVTARLQALRGQLNPHFLFNTLHSVCGLVDDRPGTARTMLVRLGDLLRSSFRDEGQEQVPLAEELGLVRSYLEIQKLRFSDRLIFNIDVEVGLETAAVPRFVLQPLAENAIMHGMADDRDRVDIRISARKAEGGGLELSVVNSSSVPARQIQRGHGVGLGNTAERLRALYAERATLHCQQDGPASFIVRVCLPFEPLVVAAA